MPKGIYNRNQKKKPGRPATKKIAKRMGRPPGSGKKKVYRQSDASGQRMLDAAMGFGALIAMVREVTKLFDLRSNLLIDSIKDLADAVREGKESDHSDTNDSDLRQGATLAPQEPDAPADEPLGAASMS